jgi:hypothetical protein
MEGWRKLLFRAMGFGIGVALTIALIASVLSLWIWHGQKPKPYSSMSITAKYIGISENENTGYADVRYVVANNTDYDYTLAKETYTHFGELTDDGAFRDSFENYPALDLPIFLPAHSKVEIVIHTGVRPLNGQGDSDTERTDWSISAARILKIVNPQLDGFVLYDDVRRLKITFPSGWRPLLSTKLSTEK